MKIIIFYRPMLICLFLFKGSSLYAQQKLLAIDSLYLESVVHFYEKAEDIKNEIWQGMELAPVCLFRVDGPALLYNHPNPPLNFKKINDKLYIGEQKGMELFGATQVEINGILTAIVDYGAPRYSCKEEAYAELFHELHHVYQRNFVKQIKFDNPAMLLRYPENYTNDGIKLAEQNILYNMCFATDSKSFQKLLNQFYSCRLKRKQLIGDFLSYEETVENMEGPAFYCEYKFYNKYLSAEEALKDNYRERHFFGLLTTPFYGREGLRNRHLAAGMAMCLILDKHFDNWESEYYAKNLSLYDFFISKFKPQKERLIIDPANDDLSKYHIQRAIEAHQVSLKHFNAQQGIKITLKFNKQPQFKGFDPMHAESINDTTILHKTLLRLSGTQGNQLFILNKDAITLIDGEIWSVKKVVFFAPKENVVIKGGRMIIDMEGRNISWSGKLEIKTEKEIVFACE